MGKWFALSPHSKRVLGLLPGQGASVQSLHVLPVSAWVFSSFLSPETCRLGVRSIGHSKLSVSVEGCLCMHISALR